MRTPDGRRETYGDIQERTRNWTQQELADAIEHRRLVLHGLALLADIKGTKMKTWEDADEVSVLCDIARSRFGSRPEK